MQQQHNTIILHNNTYHIYNYSCPSVRLLWKVSGNNLTWRWKTVSPAIKCYKLQLGDLCEQLATGTNTNFSDITTQATSRLAGEIASELASS